MADGADILHRMAVEMKALPHRGMIQVARAVKVAAKQEAVRVTGDGTLSMGHGKWHSGGKSRRPVRLNARDTIRMKPNGANCRVQGKPVGQWIWVNSGTTAHLIGVGRRKTRTRWGQHYVYGPTFDHPVRGPVYHPGMKGKNAWVQVTKRSEVIIPQVYERETARIVLGR